MVRIVDGEIVQDDDPRLQQRPQQRRPPAAAGPAAATSPAATAAAVPAGAPEFNLRAPPLRVMPDTDGSGLGGLPSLVVFGAVLRPQHLLTVAAAGMFLGWRGLMVGAILYYVWLANGSGAPQQQEQQRQPGNQSDRLAAVQGFFNQMLGQEPLGRGSGGNGTAEGARRNGSGGGEQGAPSAARQAPADPWASKGKGHKLGSS